MNREELLKNAKPILFSTEMVQAILEGRKTVTRRNPFNFEMKEGYNPEWSGYSLGEYFTGHIDSGVCLYSRGIHDVWGVRSKVVKPKYKVGDILYVRETWCYHKTGNWYGYRADGDYRDLDLRWKPSIHMPKSAARIFLKVTDVRVERLQDITEDQAIKEGVKDPYNYQESWFYERPSMQGLEYHIASFAGLWFSTIPKYYQDYMTWEANPWVWVIEFERVEERK